MAQILPEPPKGHGGIFGRTQSGKTYWALQAFRAWQQHAIFVNWQWLPITNFTRCYNMREVISTCNTIGKAVYYPEDEHAVDELLSYIYSVYRQRPRYPLLLFCDEADKYSTLTGLSDIITKGMRYNISAIVISQRPQMLQCRHILDNLYYLVFFAHSPQFWATLRERYKIELTEEELHYLNTNKYAAIYYDYQSKHKL